jgi:aspartate aminotransferase-like enzyme
MKQPLLFLPGPMQVPDVVQAAGDRPLFNHRSPQMVELWAKLEARCKPLFGTKGEVIFLASSGTGAMESAVVNLTSQGDEVIVIVGGTFAARWADIANAYGLTVHIVDVDWRRGATLSEVEAGLQKWPNAQVIFHTWSESSTGVLNDMPEIGKLIRAQNKILVADAVSGLAVSPMKMDDWNIDAVVVGSQKGLMVSPGLGVVAIGPRAKEKSERSQSPRFYFDWKKLTGSVPFTPALSLLFELDGALDFIHSQGMDKIFARRAEVAERIRELVGRSKMEIYALKPGNGITGVIPPKGFDMDALRRRLETDYGIQIAGGLGKVKDTIFRIGHVGHVTDEELDYFIQSFERCVAVGARD